MNTTKTLVAVLAVAAGSAAACNRGPRPVDPPPPSQVVADPAPAADPRVLCPPGTVQRTDTVERSLSIWCEDANGVQHGPEKTWWANGNLKSEEERDHGWPEGVYRAYYPDGPLESETPWRHGKTHGVARTWHENGKLAIEVEYDNDVPVGVGRWWDERGRLTKTKNFGGPGRKTSAGTSAGR